MDAAYEFSFDWFSRNVPVWDLHVRPLGDAGPLHALEMGCFEGRASVWLLENLLTDPASRITVVDTFEGSPEIASETLDGLFDRFLRNVERTGRLNQVRIMRMTTVQALTSLISAESDRKFNLVYVDASHRASDVLTDAVLASQVLSPGGLLVFDDYLWSCCPSPLDRPKVAIDAFLEIFQHSYEVLHKGYQVLLRKVG